jgi:hypothetical protein
MKQGEYKSKTESRSIERSAVGGMNICKKYNIVNFAWACLPLQGIDKNVKGIKAK